MLMGGDWQGRCGAAMPRRTRVGRDAGREAQVMAAGAAQRSGRPRGRWGGGRRSGAARRFRGRAGGGPSGSGSASGAGGGERSSPSAPRKTRSQASRPPRATPDASVWGMRRHVRADLPMPLALSWTVVSRSPRRRRTLRPFTAKSSGVPMPPRFSQASARSLRIEWGAAGRPRNASAGARLTPTAARGSTVRRGMGKGAEGDGRVGGGELTELGAGAVRDDERGGGRVTPHRSSRPDGAESPGTISAATEERRVLRGSGAVPKEVSPVLPVTVGRMMRGSSPRAAGVCRAGRS